jgi:F-type H+-transporting ATPase subunit a
LNATIGLSVSAVPRLAVTSPSSEVGVWGFIVHTFGPKGGLKGLMGIAVGLVFLFVGVPLKSSRSSSVR